MRRCRVLLQRQIINVNPGSVWNHTLIHSFISSTLNIDIRPLTFCFLQHWAVEIKPVLFYSSHYWHFCFSGSVHLEQEVHSTLICLSKRMWIWYVFRTSQEGLLTMRNWSYFFVLYINILGLKMWIFSPSRFHVMWSLITRLDFKLYIKWP